MTEAIAKIGRARDLLQPRQTAPNAWGTLFAATLAAVAAVLMAGVVVLGPGVTLRDAPPTVATPPA